jgi:transcriptional regulator with XRE-family HTH domain
MMSAQFGRLLKDLRLKAGLGLRRFAEMVDLEPSNVSAIEHGRRKPPADETKLREIAETLGLTERTAEWGQFFDAARAKDELPADVSHMAGRRLVPALLRTIDNRQLDDKEIAKLIDEIEKRHGGRGDALR